jgi:hypothetical protein
MSIALVSANAELNVKIEEFVKAADEVSATYWERQGFTFAKPPIHRADFISDKWVRVVTLDVPHEGEPKVSSVYAFICLQDGHTKTLGTLKAGDIHKPAGFKAPAKHARGNVFEADFRKALTANGIVYLK